MLAQQLELDGGAELFQIDENTYVFKFVVPSKLVGYHLNELNLEQEFGIKLISLIKGKQVQNFWESPSLNAKFPMHSPRTMHCSKATAWCATVLIPVSCSFGNPSVR